MVAVQREKEMWIVRIDENLFRHFLSKLRCQYTFVFSPLYDKDAPDVLSPKEMLFSGVCMVVTKYIPMLLRAVVVLMLWFGMVPWLTTCCYRLWFYRSPSMEHFTFVSRLQVPLIFSDIKFGLLINAAKLYAIQVIILVVGNWRFMAFKLLKVLNGSSILSCKCGWCHGDNQ